jgi:hypothetical protein
MEMPHERRHKPWRIDREFRRHHVVLSGHHMTGSGRLYVFAATLVSAVVAISEDAIAFDLAGAWAAKADQCNKVFVRKGRANQVDFTNFSGAYGGGFIAKPNRLRSKFEACSIKSRKDDGQTVNLVVACAKGIMLSNVQFFLKVVDDNTITRLFPGIEGMDVNYHRCKI